MIRSIKKYSKSFFFKLLVGIIILPFVFWGMGDVFSGGSQNIVAKIESKKIRADSIGNEKSIPLDEWVDIGFFTDKDEKELIGQKRIRIVQNKTNISFQLDSLPLKAAIDPRHLLIDKVYSDNIKTVNLN